jgi:signal transduction histidine kinase
VGTIEEIHLSEMLESKLLTFEASTFEKGITINSKIDSDVVIDFSRKHINQLIKILLDNSIKYTADKNVSVRLKKDNKKTTLKVSNLSTELKQEDLDNLFDRFYRKEKSRANVNGKKSYGLGLSIAKSICRSHNVKLKADLNDNIVSFTITF